jgi:hypothetical protein
MMVTKTKTRTRRRLTGVGQRGLIAAEVAEAVATMPLRAEAAERTGAEVPQEVNTGATIEVIIRVSIEDLIGAPEAEERHTVATEVATATTELRSHSTNLTMRRSAMDQSHSPIWNSPLSRRDSSRIRTDWLAL